MLSWLCSCLVVPTVVVAKTYWIECKFVAKALNLSMWLLRKDALSMKLLRKPELSINTCCESLINVTFGYEKNNPARRAAKKIILLRFCPKKILDPDRNSKPPPPLNIKRTVPYGYSSYQKKEMLASEWILNLQKVLDEYFVICISVLNTCTLYFKV